MPLPRSVTILDPTAVRAFLTAKGIEFADVWNPAGEDLLGLDAALTAHLRRLLKDAVSRSQTAHYQYIMDNLSRYQREVAGYLNMSRKFIVCNMQYSATPATDAPPAEFTMVEGGGLNALLVVLDVQVRRVIRLEWNPET